MYNSIVVRSLVRLWNFFALFYDESFLKRCVEAIKRFWMYISRGSAVKEFFISRNSLIDKTIFYRIYSLIIDIINKVLIAINAFFHRLKKASYFCRSIKFIYEKTRSFYEKNLKIKMDSSSIVTFIRDLFSADEEGDQWW